MGIEVVEATSPAALDQVRSLFEEYAASVGHDLCFQGFAEEVRSLPGLYAQPAGGLFLALVDGVPAGCVAVRPLEPPAIAEMKRLYVRPIARGTGLGRQLVLRAIECAIRAGYRSMRLDTLPTMADAQRLYRRLGFAEILPYKAHPVPGATFMEKLLEVPAA